MTDQNKIIAAQKKMKVEQATAAINDAFQSLVVETVDRQKMPEPIFKEHFLPFLSGQKDLGDNPNIVKEWVDAAKSPVAEVDVVDETGQVIFTVPPLYDTDVIDSVKRKLGESFSAIYTQYTLHSNNLPVMGERFLAETFDKKIPSMMKKSENVEAANQRWTDIFNRYNITQVNGNAVSMPAVSDVSDLDYD